VIYALAAYALAVLLLYVFRWLSAEDTKAQKRRLSLGARPRSEPLYDTASLADGGAPTPAPQFFTSFKPFDRALGGGLPSAHHHYWFGLRPSIKDRP